MGVARVREGTPLRRIDIKVYPELLEASALLHFTGSGKFNRSLSRLANQAGWILSELGLKPGEKQGDGMKGTGPYVPLRSECEIFARLGVAWCEPREREGKFSLLHPQSGRPWFES